jgi:hypothetical protein
VSYVWFLMLLNPLHLEQQVAVVLAKGDEKLLHAPHWAAQQGLDKLQYACDHCLLPAGTIQRPHPCSYSDMHLLETPDCQYQCGPTPACHQMFRSFSYDK